MLLCDSTPHSWIVETLDVVKQISLGFMSRAVLSVMDTIPLEQAEETFTGCVVTAVADGAHAA